MSSKGIVPLMSNSPVPAIGNVSQTPANLPEWRAFAGSGYGSNVIEGKTFYALDAVTGDIVQSFGLADETTAITPPDGVGPDSALVANAAGYNSFQLDPSSSTTNRGADAMTRVYIPDLHGRVWKFNTTSGGLRFEGVKGAIEPRPAIQVRTVVDYV